MTLLLQQVFDEITKLTEAEQDLLALWIRSELIAEDDFDRRIAFTSGMLRKPAQAALAEYERGETQELEL